MKHPPLKAGESLHVFLNCVVSRESDEPYQLEVENVGDGQTRQVEDKSCTEEEEGKASNDLEDGDETKNKRIVWQKRLKIVGNMNEKFQSFKVDVEPPIAKDGTMDVEPDRKPNVCCSLIIFLVGNAFAIASIVIGSLYIDECPIEPMIPIYLIVAGCASFVASTLNVIQSWGATHDQLTCAKAANRLNGLLSLFAVAWLIVGSVYTYQNYEPNYNYLDVSEIKPKGRPDYNTQVPDIIMGDNYCNKTVYLFSFISITFTYCMILIGVLIGVCVCCCGGMLLCCGKKK